MLCETDYDSLGEFSSSPLLHWTPLHFVSQDLLFMHTRPWEDRGENALNFRSDGGVIIVEARAS